MIPPIGTPCAWYLASRFRGGLAFTQKLGAQERAPQSWPTRTITIVVRRIGLS